jgi:1-acyl-sn-glycerol-3-phosphate acyltransferase
VLHARLRLSSLWVSQTTRVLADWCLGMAAFAGLLSAGAEYGWLLTTAVFITPFIILAPLSGILTNCLPRQRVLVGSAAFTLVVVMLFAALHMPWHVCLAVVALGSAVYSAAQNAVLPGAAIDARLPLPRVNPWIEMGGAAAIGLGALLGVATPSADPAVVLLGLNALCLVTSLPAAFVSDVIRPEPPLPAIVDFFRDCRRILRATESRSSLIGLAAFQALATAGAGVMLALALGSEGSEARDLLTPMLSIAGGAALGCSAAALHGHPRRCLGLVPIGATGLLLTLTWASILGGGPWLLSLLLGFMGALVIVPLRSRYLAELPADARGNGTAFMNTAVYAATTGLALTLVGLVAAGPLASPATQFATLSVLCGAATVVAWYALYGLAMEVVVEIGLLPFYRVRAHGPGAGRLPARGPLLIVSNHSAYLDPFWISKVAPRQVRPMMTSAFYDLPGIRWLSFHVARAIRVPTGTFRREAPELQEAIAALRAGECVVIFPEGMLRRSEDVLLRPFGRGVWHILQSLPDTPVSLCWIEGSWGSYFSYKGGPPGKNKQRDRGRPIDVAFSEPRPLDPSILANQQATRTWLRRAVLESRGHLGLPVGEPDQLPTKAPEQSATESQTGG